MSVRNLDCFFKPRSIALIGASARANSVGNVVARNLLGAGFSHPVWFVHPSLKELCGLAVHASVADLPAPPDLAVIATPAASVPGLVAQLGARGTKAVVVLSAGFAEMGEGGLALQTQMLEAGRPHTLRVIGPNCIGVLSPPTGVNASFSHHMPEAGGIALISQSGAMLTALVDWAAARQVGFSHAISLGAMADVDFGDLLDYLAADGQTHAVALYMESVSQARKFMSAARRCARMKPVIVIKSGRNQAGAQAARSHTGALAGADAVYDAAFRRAGILRVANSEELFDALESFSRRVKVTGDRVAIVTNGGGAGVLATDHLVEKGGKLARLSAQTIARLSRALPPTWSQGNPVDLIGDAGHDRYQAALEALSDEPEVDAIVVLNCPVAVADSGEAARAVVDSLARSKAQSQTKPIFACWLGEQSAAAARRKLESAGVPQFATPEQAVGAVLRLTGYDQARALLMEVPPVRTRASYDVTAARRVVDAALAEGRSWLAPVEAHAILTAYRIPTTDVRAARTPTEAARAAAEVGFPVALKIMSQQIVHKSDAGGVVLHLQDGPAVAQAAEEMARRIAKTLPAAKIDGFLVQQMARRPGAHELIVGISEDAQFGPVLLFGQGGTAVEVIADRALALPPLNEALARDLIARTRVSKLLAGYRDRPAADLDAVVSVLLALQDIAIDLPEVKELDINPLWADQEGVFALDARIRVAPAGAAGTQRFAIRPYPSELTRTLSDRQGETYVLRPIRPEDAGALQAAVAASDPEDIRMRFFSGLRALPAQLAQRLTQIDYDREMAFVAQERSREGIAAVVRLSLDPDGLRGEFAIIVRTDRQGQGLGFALMQEIIAYARAIGVKQIFGDVLAENRAMLKMCEELGFRRTPDGPAPGILELTLDL
jgi:acetyltransferase